MASITTSWKIGEPSECKYLNCLSTYLALKSVVFIQHRLIIQISWFSEIMWNSDIHKNLVRANRYNCGDGKSLIN